MILKIKDTGGTVTKIDFLDKIEDVKLDNKIRFDIVNENIALYIQQSIDDKKEVDVYYLKLISKAVGEFLDVDMDTIMKLDTSDVMDGFTLSDQKIMDSINNKDNWKDIDLGSVEITLMKLYNSINGFLSKYKPKIRTDQNYVFQYKEKTYYLPYLIKTLYTGANVTTKVNTSQLVEVLEIKRYLGTEFKSREGKEDQSLMDARFNAYLEIFAVLVLEEGVDYPSSDAELSDRIDERKEYFKDIDMKTVNDVVFFLMSITKG